MRRASGKLLLAAIIAFCSGLNTAQAAADTYTYGATIALGDIGKRKDSHTIVLRVVTPDGAKPPLLLHRASYNRYTDATWRARDAALEGAPTADDLQLPEKDREAYAAVAAELGLSAQTAATGVEQVKYFFANGYQYSPYQKDTAITGSPMVDFLHRAKAGHCEYFATATALLLRAGGIPARYVTGFAVTERSERENAYLVRARHAHAWVRAHVNGAWIDIDTTPPSWIAAEAQRAGWWTAIADYGSWLRFRASQAGLSSDVWPWAVGACILVFPLMFGVWMARRFSRRLK